MNPLDLQDLSPADRAFAQAARAGLRASEGLNYVEAARLSATRAQVRALINEPRHAMPVWGWFAAPAAIAAIAIALLRFEPATTTQPMTPVSAELAVDVNAPAADALMWVSDEAGPDFYRDLEFYEWLKNRSPTEPNA